MLVSRFLLCLTRVAAVVAIGGSIGMALASNVAHAAVVPPGVQLAAKQELIRNNGDEVETLDPTLAETPAANNVTRDLFEGLTSLGPDNKAAPGAAQSWEQKDPTTWIFHLRRNGKWSNGEPVVANDFVYGAQRLVDPKTASVYANTYGVFLLNGADIVAGKKPVASLGVRAIDAYTIEIKTPNPVPFLPELLTNTSFGPLNKADVDKYGPAWTRPGNLVGNGAFVLKDWQVNNKIVLVKNPQYWDAGHVVLTQVTYLAVQESTDFGLYLSGGDDWTMSLLPGDYASDKQKYPDEIRSGPVLALIYTSLNTKDPLLKDVRVRKALSMVIDRELLVQHVLAAGQLPLYGLMPKGISGADPDSYEWAAWPMAKRVEEAKKLLAQAGVQPGTTLHYAMGSHGEAYKKIAIFQASEWKTKLGLNSEFESMELKVLLKRLHTGEYQVAIDGWAAKYDDANAFLEMVRCDPDNNDAGSCNPKADALVRQAAASPDPVTRQKLQSRAVALAMADYPFIPLLQSTRPRLVKAYVGGYSYSPLDKYASKNVYIIKH